MEKIFALDYYRLGNPEHSALMNFMDATFKEYPIVEETFPEAVELFRVALKGENRAMGYNGRRELSEEMRKADEDRLNWFRFIRDSAKLKMRSQNKEIAGAAKYLLEICDMFGGSKLYNYPVDGRTGDLSVFISYSKKEFPETVRTLGFEKDFEELEKANERFLKAQEERNMIDADYGKNAKKRARKQCEFALKTVFDAVQYKVRINEGEEFAPFIRYINVEIDDYRIKLGQGPGGRKPRRKKVVETVCLLLLLLLGNVGAALGQSLLADFSDPDVIRVGEKYYMIASDFHFMGMQVLESTDLVHWDYASQVYNRLDFKEYDQMKRYGGGSWAPALRYHEGEFYIYFCTPDEGLFMTKSRSARGPWEPLHLVRKVEKWEDPCPFWDEDGQAYLGHSLYGAGPIILHKMSADGRRLLDDGVEVYRGPVAEGTKIHRWTVSVKDSVLGTVSEKPYYFMSIPEGGVRGGWQTILRSESLYGPWERRVVLEQGVTKINGPHQGAIVDTPDGRWFFFHFQETEALGRIVHRQRMNWSEDGWPVIGIDYDRNGVGEPEEPPFPAALPSGSDSFGQGALGLQWQWNHNPVDEAWSLQEHPGSLTLKALRAKTFREARNTLTQKAVGWKSVVTASLSLEEMAEGQRAGLACMGKSNHLLGALMKDGKRFLYLASDTTFKDASGKNVSIESEPEILFELPIEFQHRSLMSSATEKNYEGYDVAPQNGGPLHPLFLRLNLDFEGKAYQFEYSLDGYSYHKAGGKFYSKWGNWKGVRPALFSYNIKKEQGAAIFQDFKVGDGTALWDEEARIVEGIARTNFPEREILIEPDVRNPGISDSRARIQQAIDSLAYLGGGRLVVKPGTYDLKGSLVLKSNVNLHLEEGARLLFSGVADDFLPTVFSRWEGTELFGRSPMIYALHSQNIAITGKGEIDAQAGKEMGKWNAREKDDQNRLREQGESLSPLGERVYGAGTVLRPTCVEFVGCSRVLVEDVTIKNSPFWTIHPLYSDNVIVRGVTIDTHFPNNDGCDPESSSNVLIENCVFNVGDDAVAIKSGRDADGRRVGRPSENIVIRNCLFNSECNGLCIGSEMSGGAQNIFMHDIQIGTVKNAVYFKSNRDRGGFIRNVNVSDITVHHARGAVLRFETNYFGFRGGKHASLYENFNIRNIDAEKCDNYAFFISGYPEKPVSNVLIENVSVKEAPQPFYLHCTDGVRLRNCFVNGTKTPERPSDEPEERTLDVY